jgi:hypothetical protein
VQPNCSSRGDARCCAARREGAGLVVWWERGSNPEDDAAVREIIAAFEQEASKQVDLEQPSQSDIEGQGPVPSPTGKTPDFLFGTHGQRAGARRTTEHSDVVGRSQVCSTRTPSASCRCGLIHIIVSFQ